MIVAKKFVAKKPWATKLWLAVLMTVLAMIYFQTGNYHLKQENLLLRGSEEASGAQVFVDGTQRGLLSCDDQSGLSGAQFRGNLSAGAHAIEVRKDGCKTFKTPVFMGPEAYVAVELMSQTDK
jgi:hypothetical protein